jgi:DNA-binding winged helix-turn-helix (wHTH) protein
MRLRFGDCTFDTGTRELLSQGKSVHVSPKAFRFLELLLDCRPRALSKQELQERLWPHTFVSEANLASLAAEVRRAIGEKSRGARLIRTIHGFGYAFSGEAAEEKGPSSRRAYRYRLIWEKEEFSLAEGETILGRDREAMVPIDDSTVSRRHARIVIAGSNATIEDLGSKNGTCVGGKRADKALRLSDGDQIQLGSVFLTFHVLSPEQSTATVREPDGSSPRAERPRAERSTVQGRHKNDARPAGSVRPRRKGSRM